MIDGEGGGDSTDLEKVGDWRSLSWKERARPQEQGPVYVPCFHFVKIFDGL